MFDYLDAIEAIVSRALNVPKGHGLSVFFQLDAETRDARTEEMFRTIAATPEVQKQMAPGEDPLKAAERLLVAWADFAILDNEDGFPQSFTIIDENGTGRTRTEIVGVADADRYYWMLQTVKGSGLVGLYYEPHLREEADCKTAEKLPLIYLWEPDRAAPTIMRTINGAGIDLIIQEAIPRSHRHFRAVREWMVQRIEAVADVLDRQAIERNVSHLELPRWDNHKVRKDFERSRKALISALKAGPSALP